MVKGAFVALDANFHVCNDRVFVFQYNPVTLNRLFTYPDRSVNSSDQTIENTHGESAPIETITFQLELDATDHLEHPDQPPHTVAHGLHPALATLESMMQPTTPDGDQARPIILFLWGPNRSIPVQVLRLDITEEAFDPQLNPIRATINVHLLVLQESKQPRTVTDHPLWKNYRRQKASLAVFYRQLPFIHGYLKQLPRELRRIMAEKDAKHTRC